jgi:4-hydroxybenzoyl-CoA reductase subunit beta
MTAEQKYLKPETCSDAIALAAGHKNSFRYVAGGTDIIVNKFQGNVEADCLIDISGIEELRNVTADEKFLRIGSLIRLEELQNFPEIRNKFPSLIQVAHEVASPMIRKTATLGGNILCENRCIFYNQSEWWRTAVGYCLKCDGDICIATGGTKKCFSKFVSDTATVLIACDARIEVADIDGIHETMLEDIFTGDGINPRYLSKTALIKSILLPMENDFLCAFRKLRPREAVDFTSLTTAVSLNEDGRIKIVLGGVDPKPIVVSGASTDASDNLIQQAVRKSRIVDNDFYSRAYRKQMIPVFLERCFNDLKLK